MTVVLALLLLALSQQPRDPRAPVSVAGSAIVRGVVVDEASGAPLAECRVRVVLQRTGDMPGAPELAVEAFTDGQGKFEILDLPPGSFILSVSPGELRGSHLAKTLGAPPATGSREPSFVLRAGEVKADLRVPLARGFAIEGRLLDEYGEPMAEVSVEARMLRNGREESGYRHVDTDDRGRFRIYGLSPGKYRVCADPSSTRRVTFPGNSDPMDRARYDRACAPELVTLKGAETPLVQIQAHRVGTFSLTGSVSSATGGNPAAVYMSLQLRRADGGYASRPVDYRDGRFTATGLFPGDYFLIASLQAGAAREGVMVPVRIDGSDVTDIALTTLPAGSVSGRVTVDQAARGAMPAGLSVQMIQAGDAPAFAFGQPSSPVARDGAFTLGGLFGALQPVVRALPSGWFVKSVRYGSDDVMVQPREFRRGDPRQLEIVISDRSAALAVRATDDEGRPAAETFLVLFPSGVTLSAATMPYPRSLNQGIGTASGLPPGEYTVAVIRAEEVPRLGNSKALEALSKIGQRVTLAEGETVKVDLKVIAFPEER